MKITIYIFLIFISMNSCSHKKEELKIEDKISKVGIYTSKDYNLILNIKAINNCVEFALLDSTGHVLYNSLAVENKKGYWARSYNKGEIQRFLVKTPKASVLHKWYFCLTENGDIKFRSSDIGAFKLIKESEYKYIYIRDSLSQ